MKGEKLIIKNFGPIKEMNLDLGKITILIGEQASGKSTVAKVLAICRFFSYIVEDSNEIVGGRSKFSRLAFGGWDLEDYESPSSYVFYENDDYSVEIKDCLEEHTEALKLGLVQTLFKSNVTPKSERFRKLYQSYRELQPAEERNRPLGALSMWDIPHSFLTTDVKSVMNNPFYFPTERGLQSIFSLGTAGKDLGDRLYEQLGMLNRISSGFKNATEIEPLNIHYVNENGVGKVRKFDDDTFYRLSTGASGYQSATPIVLTVKHYSSIKRKRTFIVEEPEQNLFPVAQKKLVDFLTGAVNMDGHQMLLTTHSPYILSAIENLMYAHKMGTLEDGKYAERVEKIISRKYWINQKDVNVYALTKGTGKSVVLREDTMIDKEYIDSVSEKIIDEFDRLLEIDVEHENHHQS